MEIGESSAAGAARETLEEANAAVQILGPYAHWDIPVIGQVIVLTVYYGACQNTQTDRQKAVVLVCNASPLLAAWQPLEGLPVTNDAHGLSPLPPPLTNQPSRPEHCCGLLLDVACPHCIVQAYILFRAELAAPYTFSAGAESLDVALFDPQDIPFDEVRWGHPC